MASVKSGNKIGDSNKAIGESAGTIAKSGGGEVKHVEWLNKIIYLHSY